MATAGKNLKYLRKLRGWTQEEFATRLGIKRSLLGAYEEERAEPRTDVLELVSDIFKVTLDDLLRSDLAEHAASGGITSTEGDNKRWRRGLRSFLLSP